MNNHKAYTNVAKIVLGCSDCEKRISISGSTSIYYVFFGAIGDLTRMSIDISKLANKCGVEEFMLDVARTRTNLVYYLMSKRSHTNIAVRALDFIIIYLIRVLIYFDVYRFGFEIQGLHVLLCWVCSWLYGEKK